MGALKSKGGRERSRSHEETDDRIESLLRLGPKTRNELAEMTGLAKTTIWFCLQRLVKQQRACQEEGPKAITHAEKRAGRSVRFKIDDSTEARQLRVSSWTGEARRHPQDVALFGEYKAAA